MYARARLPSSPSSTPGLNAPGQAPPLGAGIDALAKAPGGGMEAARALLGSRVRLDGPLEEDRSDPRPMREKLGALRAGIEAADDLLEAHPVDVVEARLPGLTARFGMQWLTLVEDDEEHVHVEGKVNPKGESKKKSKKRKREEDEDDQEKVKKKKTEDGAVIVRRKAVFSKEKQRVYRRSQSFTSLERPDRDGKKGKKSTGLEQPVHTWSDLGKKRNPWKPGKKKTWEERVDGAELPEATVEPRSTRVKGLGKFSDPTETMDEVFEDLDLKKVGGHPSGFRPEGDDVKTNLVGTTSFEGKRTPQVLMELSEVFRSLTKATEVQFGYGLREGGGLDLFASANEESAQDELLTLMTNPAGALKLAAKSKNARIARMAGKLVFYAEQEKERREAIEARYEGVSEKPKKGESKKTSERRERRDGMRAELDLARMVYDKALNGDVTVVKNRGERHAEQNIADVLADGAEGKDPYTLGDIQGTKIRCGACSGALGRNAKNGDGKTVSGSIWPAHTSAREMKALLEEVQEEDHCFSTSTRRYDSDSSVASEDSEDSEAV